MSKLQEMRETWRPRLAHSVEIQCRFAFPIAITAAILKPEAGVAIVSILMALYGLAGSLFGIRQWGKNKSAE